MHSQTLIIIIQSIVSLLSIAGSYYFGIKTQEKKDIKNNLKNRYEQAYVPVIKLLIIDLPNSPNFITNRNVADEYCNIIINNIYQYEELTWDSCYPFYNSYLEYMGYKEIHPDLQSRIPYININFINVIKPILQEGSKISKRLSEPDISTYLLHHIEQSCMPPKGWDLLTELNKLPIFPY